MSAFRVILHPTDFSPPALYAFRAACELAKAMGARLILLHVDEPIPVMFGEMFPLNIPSEGGNKALMNRLAEMGPLPPGVAVERYVTPGNPVEEIVRFVEEHHCDLIVMGTLGRTGLGRLLMGSVAEKILRKAPCAVLTVKAPIMETVPNEDEAALEAVI